MRAGMSKDVVPVSLLLAMNKYLPTVMKSRQTIKKGSSANMKLFKNNDTKMCST